MGYGTATSMSTDEMKKTYEMVLTEQIYPDRQLIHHSEIDLQFCSAEYVKLSIDSNDLISTTENEDPYKTALAERMNRTLKDKFGLGRQLPTPKRAFTLAEEAVYLHNHYRLHNSPNTHTPQYIHLQ